ncbi:muscarinic acetylcholine receptor M2-like [Anneissia japonica]|uniref:muscarinic acetylcholine receptor M2-like n=1 Tax=Anneissia japonica TaxID=1529436 RepID=UPI00142558D7|nr:muscarinic acetylcholine receptor M2-like [Anneissia japonica]
MENLTNLTTDETTHSDGNGQRAIFMITCSVLLGLIIFISNMLTLLAFWKEKHLRTYTNFLVLSLNVADISTGLVIIAGIICISSPDQSACDRINNPMKDIHNTLLLTSNFNIITIAIDRLYAVTRPVKYRLNRSTKRLLIMCLSPWATATLVWTSLRSSLTIFQESDTSNFYSLPAYYNHIWSATLVTFIYFWGPITIITLIYGKLFCKIKKRNQLKKIIVKGSANENKRQITVHPHIDSEVEISSNRNETKISEAGMNLTIVIPSKDQNETLPSTTTSHSQRQTATPNDIQVLMDKRSNNNIGYLEDAEVDIQTAHVISSGQVNTERKQDTMRINKGQTIGKEKWLKGSNKAYLTLSLIILFYILSWTGFSVSAVVLALMKYQPTVYTNREALTTVFNISFIFKYMNSAINPLAIIIAQPLMRITLRHMFKCNT